MLPSDCEAAEGVAFLDTFLSIRGGRISSKLFRKPSDRNMLLMPTSARIGMNSFRNRFFHSGKFAGILGTIISNIHLLQSIFILISLHCSHFSKDMVVYCREILDKPGYESMN